MQRNIKMLMVILLLSCIFIVGICNGQQKKDGFVIGYSVGFVGNAWRGQHVSFFEEEANDYVKKGVLKSYQVVSADNDSTKQLSQCNALLSMGVDALLICAVSPQTLTPVVERAKALGVLVVIANDPAAYEGTVCVANDAVSFTEIQAKWFKEMIGEKADVVYISGNPGNATDILRSQVWYDMLKENPDINLLAEAPGRRNQTESQRIMTTFLSTYPKIDGIMCENVTSEGVIKAYENLGKKVPVLVGDSVVSFLKKWASMDGWESIAVTNSPAVSVACLHTAIALLQGYKLDESRLSLNPVDPKLKNTILVDPPYCITRTGDPNAPWMKGYPFTEAITLDKALTLFGDKPDTYIPDKPMTMEQILTFFK